eukprot:g35716.t1
MQWNEILIDLSAGTVGGVAGIIAGYPLDTLRVRLQTLPVSPGGAAQSLAGRTKTWKSLLAGGSRQGFFKGMLSPIASNAPINAIVFAAYGQSCRVIQEAKGRADPTPLTPGDSFLAGASAGLGQTIIAGPSELVKVTLQSHPEAHREGSFRCAKKLYQEHGLRKGLFRGFGITVLRDTPSWGAYFYTYAMTKYYLSHGQKDKATDLMLLTAGGTAGLVSWLVIYPIDVLKSCWQGLSPEQAARTSISKLATQHYQAEGYRFFTRGLGITCLRSFPVSAITFLFYEKTLATLTYLSTSLSSGPDRTISGSDGRASQP